MRIAWKLTNRELRQTTSLYNWPYLLKQQRNSDNTLGPFVERLGLEDDLLGISLNERFHSLDLVAPTAHSVGQVSNLNSPVTHMFS